MSMYPTMNDLFGLLDKWRHFAGFPLEARSEVLFALFLPSVLEKCKSIGKVNPLIIPQFPLKKETDNKDTGNGDKNYYLSNKVDFFALSECGKRAFLIELKTDINSRREGQDNYLEDALDKSMHCILLDLKEMSKSKNDKHARQSISIWRMPWLNLNCSD